MSDKSISPEKVPYLWLLLIKKKWNVTEICRKLKRARSCVYTYKMRRIYDMHNKKSNKGGRPKKINERDMWKLRYYKDHKIVARTGRNVHPRDLLGKRKSIKS